MDKKGMLVGLILVLLGFVTGFLAGNETFTGFVLAGAALVMGFAGGAIGSMLSFEMKE